VRAGFPRGEEAGSALPVCRTGPKGLAMPLKSSRVLGIDASLRSTGLAVVEQRGSSLHALEWSQVRVPSDAPHSKCLRRVQEAVLSLLKNWNPEAAALEGGFYMKNAKTALVLGEVRGVVIAACAGREVPVYEYSPRRVKQAVVGSGSAHKSQVAKMVMKLAALNAQPQEDAADAMALAICHLQARSGHAVLDNTPL